MCKIVCFLFLFMVVSVLSQADNCITPSNERGQCINIKNCQPVISILTNSPKPLPQATKQMLAALGCGYENRVPKVCCVDSGPTQGGLTRPSMVTRDAAQGTNYYSEAPPTVDGHPNLRLLSDDCGETEENRILGGTRTGIYEFPWMALISYGNANNFKCGGTIINSRYILTAAHCVVNLGRNVLYGVRVGEHDTTKDIDCEEDAPTICAPRYQDIRIAEAIPHPGYSVGGSSRPRASKLQHDIALLRLATPIDLTRDNTRPICLPIQQRHRDLQLDRETLVATGWGTTENGISSTILLKVNLPYVSNDECGRVLNSTTADGVGFRQLCAGGREGSDSCNGDSGGPLQATFFNGYLRYVQYGITSYGPRNCGIAGAPSVYTRVSHYVKWILDTIKP